jgi:DNA-binding Lrp family transcriptional regulator
VKWLEEQGYITGYRAEIDRRKIGLGVLAFVRVDAERNNAEATRALEDAIRALPEVVACHYISGAGTFELQVVATDLDAYSRWAMDTLFKLPNVKDMHTSFSLGEVKAGAALPLGHLRARRLSAASGGNYACAPAGAAAALRYARRRNLEPMRRLLDVLLTTDPVQRVRLAQAVMAMLMMSAGVVGDALLRLGRHGAGVAGGAVVGGAVGAWRCSTRPSAAAGRAASKTRR